MGRLAKMDGSKPVRGGVPIVFPQFGRPDKDMPQHGFLRRNYWKNENVFSTEEEAGCDFTLDLKDVVEARGEKGIWSKDGGVGINCSCRYQVRINADKLITKLIVQNTGTFEFKYQTLYHNYFRVNAKALELTSVQGFQGYSVENRVTDESSWVQDQNPIKIDCEVDRLYTPPSSKNVLDVVISTGEDKPKLLLKSYATANGAEVPVSAVIWNPFVEKSKTMSDFHDDEYLEMIGVEPGVVDVDNKGLAIGAQLAFTQEITSVLP